MQAVQQFFLLLVANLRRVYSCFLGLGLYLGLVFLLYAVGFFELAIATAIFLWCVIARPSVELKNMHYLLWSLRFSPIIIFNYICLFLWHLSLPAVASCVGWEVVSGFMQIILLGFFAPILIFSNLYLLDSGLHLKRLFCAPRGIVKMYWYTWYICMPIGMFFALSTVFMPFIITMLGVIPIVVTLSVLVYYKYLYEQFRIYYAAD